MAHAHGSVQLPWTAICRRANSLCIGLSIVQVGELIIVVSAGANSAAVSESVFALDAIPA